jgi:hypothetical protein
MSQLHRTPARDRLRFLVVGSAWASALLVGTGWALVATAPIIALTVAVVVGGRRWRPVLPFAVALGLSQGVAIALWATSASPEPSLTKSYDPVHAGITVALGVLAAVAAHVTTFRRRRSTAAVAG